MVWVTFKTPILFPILEFFIPDLWNRPIDRFIWTHSISYWGKKEAALTWSLSVAFGSHNELVVLQWSAAAPLCSASTSHLPPCLSDLRLSIRIGSLVCWCVLSLTEKTEQKKQTENLGFSKTFFCLKSETSQKEQDGLNSVSKCWLELVNAG